MAKKRSTPSPETQAEALRIARANQRPGQTKEQTRLIAQGIEKGIAQYKKQQKARARDQDRARKQQKRSDDTQTHDNAPATAPPRQLPWLPWILLVLSWAGFASYLLLT